MSILRGEDLNIGIGVEGAGARGTFVEPQAFIPGKTPAGVKLEIKKTLLKETRASGISSQGAEIVQKQVVGGLEFNLRSETIGYLLKSLLGKCTTVVEAGTAYRHTFEVLKCNPQFPTLSLALAQCGAFKDYGYNNCLVKSLEIKTPVDDLVSATAEFIGSDEAEKTAFSLSFNDSDYIFRPQDIKIKIADDVAGLAGADALGLKEFSIAINNSGRPQFNIGELAPNDNIAGLIEITGEMVLDYEDATYHDIYVAGEYKAMEITFERADITIGTAKTPKLVITLPKISFEGYDPDRPLDDIVRDKLSFVAHYDEAEEEALNAYLINEVVDYDADPVS